MSQPPSYLRQYNFADYQANFPSTPLPGVAVDAELSAAKATLDAVLSSLALLQRDDGALRNALVSLDSLSPAVIAALGAGSKWTPRGLWVTATAYALSDVISVSTATYVCATAHTAGIFATDLAAGRWVLLFDSAGATPADGSVTSAKLAPGAVTTAKIGFTGLDLSGNIRGGGIQAGIAPLGSLMHAKLAAGSVYAKIERSTDAQGPVGYQIIGQTVTWTLYQPAGGTGLSLGNSALGNATTVFDAAGWLDQVGHIRATGSAVPTSGSGIALSFSGGVGYCDSYDWATPGWESLKLRGADVYLTASAVDVVHVTSTGIDVTGTVTRGGVDLGYLDVPVNVKSSAYALLAADRGKQIYSQNVAGQTITIPTGLPVGTVIAIVNDGSNPITISPAGGVTLKQAGTILTGSRTLAVNGMASLDVVATDRVFISGVGIS